MKRTSVTFVVIGLLILAGIGYYTLNSKNSNNQNPDQNSNKPTTVTVNFDYKNDGTYQEKVAQVTQGQHVVITATSDLADEVHFHGYDLSADVTPNSTAKIEFDAIQTGRFEIELENSKKTLGFIEIYPK